MPPKKKKRKAPAKRRAPARSRGPRPEEVPFVTLPSALEGLAAHVVRDGGRVLAGYKDPLGGHPQLFVSVPLERVEPTDYQRDLSDAHMKRLAAKIDRLDRFLDPILLVRSPQGAYLTPNGYHRASAMKRLGARAITALLVPDLRVAHQILALNTEKAYNVKEKSLEAVRLCRELARLAPGDKESDYANEFEEPPFLTLGHCYEARPRFSGGAYQSVLRRTHEFLEERLGKAMQTRAKMSRRLLKLDDGVAGAVEALKKRGLKSPYLKTFVVARINPLRWRKSLELFDFDETLDEMETALKGFDPSKIQPHHLAAMGGAAPDE